MTNREKRTPKKILHLFIGLKRKSKGADKQDCTRYVINENEPESLRIFENQLLAIGGEWRIHKTVNARDVEKTRKHLLKNLIDYPEKASYVNAEWRTSLLQTECKAERYFMLDIDTQDEEKIKIIDAIIEAEVLSIMSKNRGMICYGGDHPLIREKIKSPSGWHYITDKFDTRAVEKLEYVSLHRDGCYYIKSVGANK